MIARRRILTERRWNRTIQAPGCDALPVLKARVLEKLLTDLPTARGEADDGRPPSLRPLQRVHRGLPERRPILRRAVQG